MTQFDLSTATAHVAWNSRWLDAGERAEWSSAEPDVREVAATVLPARGVRRVLDLGTGIGRHALALARAGFEVTACDAAPAGLEVCRAEAAAAGLAIRLDEAQMTDLPYGDGAFDYVLAFNVIYHGEPGVVRRAIAEIHRVLAPGGLYQGTMLSKRNANFGRGTEVAPDTFVRTGDDDKGHPHFYCDARGLCALFAGFEPLKLEDRLHRKPGSWHWHLLAERRP
ncbi:MAG: class I SAM-dependent methyltransferase [Alphaproteobacteria bacterium]